MGHQNKYIGVYSKRTKLRGIKKKVTKLLSSYAIELRPFGPNSWGAERYSFPIDPYRVSKRLSVPLQSAVLQKAIDETYRLIISKSSEMVNTRFVCTLELNTLRIEINHFLDQDYYNQFFARGFTYGASTLSRWKLNLPQDFKFISVPMYLPEGGLSQNDSFICFGEGPS